MWVKKIYTLVFLRTPNQILLGLKKRGFGMNKWNGFGGKVEPNENIVDGAVRELKEECVVTVTANDLKHVGHLEFTFEGEPTLMDVRVFSATVWQGVPQETEEMSPKWFDNDCLPFGEMWPDDRYWFTYMLQNRPFYAAFHYQGYDTILTSKICEIGSMEKHYAALNDDNNK